MKKTILIVMALGLVSLTNAQIRFGIKASGNLTFQTSKYDGVKQDGLTTGCGFNLGGIMEYALCKPFSLQSGIFYMQNNVLADITMDHNGESIDFDGKFIYNQVQLPVYAKYKLGTGNTKFFVMAGPYFGYIFSGKMKGNGSSINEDLYGKNSDLKHFDFGFGTEIGIEIHKFSLGAGYQCGLINLSEADKVSQKLSNITTLSVGYFF